MKTIFIFEPINNTCRGSLPGTSIVNFTSSLKIYGIPSSKNTFEIKHSLRCPANVPHSNSSKDDGIFCLPQFMLAITSILLGHRQLKSLHLPVTTGLDQATAIATGSKELFNFFLGTFSFLSYFPLLVFASVLSFPSFFSFKMIRYDN